MSRLAWLAALGAAAGTLALVATGEGGHVSTPPRGRRHRMDWVERVIAAVSRHEGGYASQNRNTDRAGLSFGIIQWSQRTGELGKLLARMQAADPELFAATFGPEWRTLLETTKRGSLDPVGGAVLWAEPWTSRFRRAGGEPVFQAVQRRLARDGEHFRAAEQTARALGVTTERALALFYDTAVQQGPGRARRVADELLSAWKSQGRERVGYAELLAAYAQKAADAARRRSAPTKAPSAHLAWRRVGDEWHLFAGEIDLYANIKKRRDGIVASAELADDDVALA